MHPFNGKPYQKDGLTHIVDLHHEYLKMTDKEKAGLKRMYVVAFQLEGDQERDYMEAKLAELQKGISIVK